MQAEREKAEQQTAIDKSQQRLRKAMEARG